MDKAREEAEAGTPEGTVVIAERQSTGRGRFNRVWASPPGNIYLSVVLRPPSEVLPHLSLLSALAVAKAVDSLGLHAYIHWPNDVLLNGKKVAGILIEGSYSDITSSYTVVGIGVNVNADPAESLPELADKATSLKNHSGSEVPLAEFLKRILERLDTLYWAARRGELPWQEWHSRLFTLGRRVTVKWRDELYTGMAEDVDVGGALLLRLDNGSLVTLPAGEATLQS
jgi:BirA family biotin operon repressor/biotin-[acetyl-CoA-carboxylase] ligase